MTDDRYTEEVVRRAIDAAIEQCAKIAESHNGRSPKDSRDIAKAIRSLSKTKEK